MITPNRHLFLRRPLGTSATCDCIGQTSSAQKGRRHALLDRPSRIKIEQVPAQPSDHFLEYQLEPTQILLSQLRTQGVDVIDLARSSDAPTGRRERTRTSLPTISVDAAAPTQQSARMKYILGRRPVPRVRDRTSRDEGADRVLRNLHGANRRLVHRLQPGKWILLEVHDPVKSLEFGSLQNAVRWK